MHAAGQDMHQITINFGTAPTWDLQDLSALATIFAAIMAVPAIIVALIQFVGASRASSRAEMNAVFREYLALRADENANSTRVYGFKFYAMEEVYYWAIDQRKWFRIPFRMPPSEQAAWLATVRHHVDFRGAPAEREYFEQNARLFGSEFVKYVMEVNGAANSAPQKTETTKPSDQPGAATAC